VEALITQTADQKIKPSRELFARQNRVQCERAFMFTKHKNSRGSYKQTFDKFSIFVCLFRGLYVNAL